MKQILLLWSIFCIIADGYTECNDGYECAFQSVSDSSYTQCDGYFSCAQAFSIVNTPSTNSFVYCRGSFSCYKADTISAGLASNNAEIECSGLYVCYLQLTKLIV